MLWFEQSFLPQIVWPFQTLSISGFQHYYNLNTTKIRQNKHLVLLLGNGGVSPCLQPFIPNH